MSELELRHIYKENKENIFKRTKVSDDNYMTVWSVLGRYENFYRFLREMYQLCNRQEKTIISAMSWVDPNKDELKFKKLEKELEDVKKENQKVYDLITKYSRVFPIYLKKYGVIVSENITCPDSAEEFNNKFFNDKDDLFNEKIQFRIRGDFGIYDLNGNLIASTKKDEMSKKEWELITKILNMQVDTSKVPTYLNTNIRYSKLTRETFIEALERHNQEYDKLTEESKKFIEFENLNKEKEYDEERARAREEHVRQHNEKIEQLKMQMLGILATLDSMTDESTTKIQKYPVSKEVLFVTGEDGVTRIDKRFIPVLKYIDLSGYGFENVDISGIDFSDCNVININPQKVFNKDLSNTIFVDDLKRPNNIFPFNASTNFEGVNLSGAQIIIDKPIFIKFNGAITDSETLIQMNGKEIELNNNRKIV